MVYSLRKQEALKEVSSPMARQRRYDRDYSVQLIEEYMLRDSPTSHAGYIIQNPSYMEVEVSESFDPVSYMTASYIVFHCSQLRTLNEHNPSDDDMLGCWIAIMG